jgi:hypothetical protein
MMIIYGGEMEKIEGRKQPITGQRSDGEERWR